MSDLEKSKDISASRQEESGLDIKPGGSKTIGDYLSLAITTCGVGYLPLAPGTWGSIVGVLIYLAYGHQFSSFQNGLVSKGEDLALFSAFAYFITSILLLLICLVGILASARVEKILNNKDPQIIVVDEVMGQLITFAFVPFGVSWEIVLAGFLLFRLFDIWKPYPVKNVESLSNGIGVCADDIVAGIYAGVCLSILYAISLSF